MSTPAVPAVPAAPECRVAEWLNAPQPLSLAALRGRATMAVAFQMLCPGCVAHALPQAQRVREAFPESDLAVVGLHTVFEHHDAQGPAAALRAFLHEYRIAFPVGIDAPSPDGGVPQTMAAYAMQGTPTLLLIDRVGRLRMRRFGHLDDLRLGAALAALIDERGPPDSRDVAAPATADPGCDEAGCTVDPKA